MPNHLPSDFFPRLNGFLQPFMKDADEREAWLTQAFYLREPRLYYQIDRAGSAMVFTTKCIQKLLDFACLLEPTEHALAALLNTVRYGCGENQYPTIDDFVSQVNALCVEPPPTPEEPQQPPTPPKNPAQSLETPNADRTPTVFISYSHEDKAFAERLIADLQAAGHAVWIDVSRLKGGDLWIRAISEGIINSYAFVVLATRRALASAWVQDEILWAKQRGKLIIPLLLEDVLADSGFFPLAGYQGVKFFDHDYSDAFRALLTGLPVPPTAQAEPIEQPPTLTRRALELQYLDRLRFEVLLNTERYTPLSGTSQRSIKPDERGSVPFVLMRPEYALLGRERHAMQETRRFDNAVQELLALRQAVVLGEPGAGKTTTLWKVARQLADAAITDEKQPIPLVLRLGKWTEEGQSLEAFIRSELGELGNSLDDLLHEKRAALLLDGLNEIPVSRRMREYRDRQVQRLFEQHTDLIALVTCRAQDYTLDLGFNRVEITPLDPIRIREFCVRYLGDDAGAALFERLIGQDAAQTERRFLEWASKETISEPECVFWLEGSLPDDERWGWGSTDNSYWQRWVRQREHPASLLVLARNPYMLSMLTQVYVANEGRLPDNRGELFRDFALTLLVRERLVEVDANKRPILNADANALLDGLARLAYAMQIERSAATEGNALTSLPMARAHEFLTAKQVYQAGSASLISVGEAVRFSHQLLQEYFAARYMDNEIRAGRLKADDIWQLDKWWERTNWEEAAILLAGLYSDDCTTVLNWLADANPEVAAQCIVRSGAHTPDATKVSLRDRWLPRLTDVREPVLARATVGRTLGLFKIGDQLADNRRGVGLREDGLPDIVWCEVPAGEFIYQKGEKLTLPTFSIAKFPITYSQFQAFIDAPDGFTNPTWWDSLATSDEHKAQPGDQAFKFGNHPRERVSWYDAVAFCRWLSAQLGYEVRLPTEFEWEKAARANTGWQYPYGDEFDKAKCNTSATGIGQTSAVGIFPDGASPYGALDMSGNVFEWCLNEYSRTKNIGLRGSKPRVRRGGSWHHGQDDARAAFRDSYAPYARDFHLGFRLVVSSPI